MKKALIYSMILSTAVFCSCKGDYDDWADPQGYPQEEAKNVTLTVTPTSAIDMATVETDSINLFSASIQSEAPMSIESYKVELGKTDESGNIVNKQEINASTEGKVATEDLKTAVETLYGKAPDQRTIETVVVASLKQNGQAFYTKSNQVQTLVTLVKPNISSAYYLVGDMFEKWDASHMVKFSHSDNNVYDDPVFKITFETLADNQYWKIIPQENVDGEFWANPGVVGPKVDGDDSMTGSLTNENPGAGKIAKAGKYIMTINMMDYTYTIEEAPTELYMTGSAFNSWNSWHQLTPVYGTDDQFWTITYLAEGDEFKFAPQAGWGNDFGFIGAEKLNDAAGAGLTDNSGNLKVGKSGWYLLHVTNGEDRNIEVLEPNVYLIGDAAGEWNIDAKHKFTVPTTKDGSFVSPAFASDAELRMCVSIVSPDDWWKTEFIIRDGKIDYRGKGGDQYPRVNVTKGQKAYLNFTAGTGEIK